MNSDSEPEEHKRYAAFVQYLTEHRPLTSRLAIELFEQGLAEPDFGLGGAMLKDIVELPECPIEVLEKAKKCGHEWLVKVVRRQELLREIGNRPTAECFERCLDEGDNVAQLRLVRIDGLSRDQVEQLATKGVNRSIRNLAKVRLRSKWYVSDSSIPPRTCLNENEAGKRLLWEYAAQHGLPWFRWLRRSIPAEHMDQKFGNLQQWKAMKSLMQPGDQIWPFKLHDNTYQHEGYVVLRNGSAAAGMVTVSTYGHR